MHHLVSAAVFLVAAVPALGATRKVPQQFATINAAIGAANPGDTIKISKGEYRENVVVDVADLTIKGEDGVVIDARPDGAGGSGSGVDVEAAGVTIQDVVIRHAKEVEMFGGPGNGSNVWVNAAGCELRRVTSQHAAFAHLATTTSATELRVIDSTFQGAGGSFVLGADTSFDGCFFERCGSLELNGPGGEVKKCTFDGCSAGVIGLAPLVRVTKCTLRRIMVLPFLSLNDGATFSDNRVEECGGALVRGNDALVRGNQFVGSLAVTPTLAALQIDDCSGASVEDNEFEDCCGGAIAAFETATGCTITGNSIKRCRLVAAPIFLGASIRFDAGIDLQTNGAIVSGNNIKDCGGDGIHVFGDNNQILENVVKSCLEDGIDVMGVGNTVNGNEAKKNGAEGLENNGSMTVMNDNVASKNRIDIANDGSFASFTGNTPAGTPPPPEIDIEPDLP